MKLQRSINSFGLLFAGISSVIGSGWLFGPLFAAQIAGPAAVISWVVGGVLMVVIALTFAELGGSNPVAGGMIQLAQQSHGYLLSFIVGWMVWISSVAVAPVETLGLIQYASNYLPGLMVSTAGTSVLTYTGIFVAAVIMLIMSVLNYYGALFFSRSNMTITLIKLFVPITTIFLLVTHCFKFSNFNSTNGGGFAPYGWHGILAALPLGGVIYSFIGSNTILQLAGETKNPRRSIPIALIGSMIFCSLLYVLLQIAFVGSINPTVIAKGWSELHFANDTGPFVGVVTALGLGWFVMIIYADAIISPFGAGYVFTATTARVGYALSEIKFFPKLLQKLSERGVPVASLAVNYCIGLLLFLPFPSWQKLVSFIISCFLVSYIVGPLSLSVLRKRTPEKYLFLPNVSKISLVAFYICNLLIFWTGWYTVSKMMVAITIGVIVFALRLLQRKITCASERRTAWWVFSYFTMLSIISYLGTFGGGLNIIPFGIDFLVIGILSAIIFYFAQLDNIQELTQEGGSKLAFSLNNKTI